jgi:hypothetical protein
MKIFNKLNKSSLGPKASRATTGDSEDRVSNNLQYAEIACFQLASVKRRSIPSKLGLKHSAQILLDIIKAAQNSKFYRAACIHVANQAFHLLNAVDGGVQGGAIDVNNVLRDYINRLNQDFISIWKILTNYTSWWSFSYFWAASREIQKCHDLVDYGMAMYLLLLRCSIARGEEQIALRWQYNQAVAHSLGQKTSSFNYSITRSVVRPPQKQKKSNVARPYTTATTTSVHQLSGGGPKWATPHYRQPVR